MFFIKLRLTAATNPRNAGVVEKTAQLAEGDWISLGRNSAEHYVIEADFAAREFAFVNFPINYGHIVWKLCALVFFHLLLGFGFAEFNFNNVGVLGGVRDELENAGVV